MPPFRLIRSRRKTLALIVERDGSLAVRAPLRLSLSRIQSFVERKAAWIQRKQAQAQAALPLPSPKQFVDGEQFWYLGHLYPLHIVDVLPSSPAQAPAGHVLPPSLYRGGAGSGGGVLLPSPRGRGGGGEVLLLHDRFYLHRLSLPQAPALFQAWYRRQARQVITDRLHFHAQKMNAQFTAIRITSARTRWGSCSSCSALSFTWRLVMAPLPVIDYVIVHELVHLIEKNHSHRFWDKVKIFIPDYKDQVAWLKHNGHKLVI